MLLEAIRNRAQSWIAKVILGLMTIPFAFWGIDSYFSSGGKGKPAATLGSGEISEREFLRAVKDQREALGGKVDEKALRKQVMDQMVNTRLLADAAQKAGFGVFASQIEGMLGGAQAFQENGKFSQARLDAWLRSRGMSQGELMQLITQDILLNQVQAGYGEGAVLARPSVDLMARLLGQQREVNEVLFEAKAYLKSVRVDDKAVEAEYNAHKADYATPAMVKLQYAVLSEAGLGASIQVSDEQAKKYFESNAARYQEPDKRRASHILIKVEPGANAQAKEAARQKAEQLLAEVRKAPARFADLARQNSQDPGSAANGGDLGAFTRDMMVKPFADTVFGMKAGDMAGPVETQFGYHLIRLDGVMPGARMGFEVVKADILQDLKRQEAQRRFIESAERFSNLVYEQPESLAPAAKEFGLKLEESGWITKTPAQGGVLANPRLLEQVFAQDSVTKRQNVEAVEVAPNTLLAARVIDYRAAGQRPLAEVAGEIKQRLALALAARQAVEAGRKALEAMKAGQSVAGLSAPIPVSRMRAQNLPQPAVKAIFRADVNKLPAYVGAETPDGYRAYRINRVTDSPADPRQAESMRVDLRRLQAQEELRAYMEDLKSGAKVVIEPAMLEARAE
ncbi:MAG: SurA N-terminal domain-containing protein [Betaproteobacteria bacterium]|nr:SurA N-terminal domain-containing protein [Betaproteobacteria bacterium]